MVGAASISKTPTASKDPNPVAFSNIIFDDFFFNSSASISRMVISHFLKIEFDCFRIFQHIAVSDADLVNVVLLQFSRNLRNVSSECFKVVGAFVMVAHTAGRHKVFNVVRAGILWVPRPLRLEVVYLHIIVGNVATTVSAMTVKFIVHRNAGIFIDCHLFILAVLIVVKSSVRFNGKFFFFPSCITGFIIFARSKAHVYGTIIAALIPFANFAILAHCIIQRILIQIAYNNASAAERAAFNFHSNPHSATSSS
nr:MAG TPA_asm: hypothetical protein [Caudoviricetes sp.]